MTPPLSRAVAKALLTTAECRLAAPQRHGHAAAIGGVGRVEVPAVSQVSLPALPVGALELGVAHAVPRDAVAVAAAGALLGDLRPRLTREARVEYARLYPASNFSCANRSSKERGSRLGVGARRIGCGRCRGNAAESAEWSLVVREHRLDSCCRRREWVALRTYCDGASLTQRGKQPGWLSRHPRPPSSETLLSNRILVGPGRRNVF